MRAKSLPRENSYTVRNLRGRIYNSPPLLKIRPPYKKSPHPLKILPYLNALVLKWEIFTM